MKDYHDLLLIIRETNLLNVKKLAESIKHTFSNRNTNIKLPIGFDGDGLSVLQRLWSNHLHNLGVYKEKLNLPVNIVDVIIEINQWLEHNCINAYESINTVPDIRVA